jgi:hypothetical protein
VTTYIAYIDDSGDENTSVYTALLIPIQSWTTVLRAWLTFRANIYTTFFVPADYELHAKELVQAGRGRPAPSIQYGINTELSKRKRVYEAAMATIAQMSDLRIICKVMPHVTPERCYSALIAKIEEVLAAEDGYAILVVDGDGSQPYQKSTHRGLKLANRRIVEDPWFQGAHLSQLVQMADLVSYAMFQSHSLRVSRQWLWGYFAHHLHTKEWEGCCACP